MFPGFRCWGDFLPQEAWYCRNLCKKAELTTALSQTHSCLLWCSHTWSSSKGFCCTTPPGHEGVLKKVLIFLCTAILFLCLLKLSETALALLLCRLVFWSTHQNLLVRPQKPECTYILSNFPRVSVCSVPYLLPFSFCCQSTCVLSDSWTVQQSHFSASKTTPASVKLGITDPAKLTWHKILFISEYHWGLHVKGTKGIILIQPDIGCQPGFSLVSKAITCN